MPKNFRMFGWLLLLLLSIISVAYMHQLELDSLAEVTGSMQGLEIEFGKYVIETLRKVMIATFH